MDKKYVYPDYPLQGIAITEFQLPICLKTEVISVFTQANAKSLGKLAAFMANKGTLNGVELISEATWNEMMSDLKEVQETTLVTRITKGGFNLYKHTSSLGKPA